MIRLPSILEAAGEIQSVCEKSRWRFCIIGGVAVQRWGQPRLTQDVDLTILTGFGAEEEFTDLLLQAFKGRRDDARAFALRHRVLLLKTDSGVPIDVAFGALPFEERSIQRASPWNWSTGQSLLTCSAEDLIVHKVFAGRDRDWADVETILVRQFGKIELNLARSELQPLLEFKADQGSLRRLANLENTVRQRLSA